MRLERFTILQQPSGLALEHNKVTLGTELCSLEKIMRYTIKDHHFSMERPLNILHFADYIDLRGRGQQ